MKIGIICAMPNEAQPIIDYYKLIYKNEYKGFKYYENNNKSIILGLNGIDFKYEVERVGTVPAALNTQLLLSKYKVDIILNIGIAGGVNDLGAKIDDIYINGNKTYNHDRIINIPGGYSYYGYGRYRNLLNYKFISDKFNIKNGIISTGNSLDLNEGDKKVMNQLGTVVKDMEAAAINWVCELYYKPFLAIKGISDLIDSDNNDEKTENMISNMNKTIYLLGIKSVEIINWLKETKIETILSI